MILILLSVLGKRQAFTICLQIKHDHAHCRFALSIDLKAFVINLQKSNNVEQGHNILFQQALMMVCIVLIWFINVVLKVECTLCFFSL